MIPLCPACGTAMLILELEEVEVDHCPECGGTWLDEGEIFALAGGGADDPLMRACREKPELRPPTQRRCARCDRKLRKATVATTPPIELDICAAGHGVWFDRNELDQVLARLAARPPAIGFLQSLLDPAQANPRDPKSPEV